MLRMLHTGSGLAVVLGEVEGAFALLEQAPVFEQRFLGGVEGELAIFTDQQPAVADEGDVIVGPAVLVVQPDDDGLAAAAGRGDYQEAEQEGEERGETVEDAEEGGH